MAQESVLHYRVLHKLGAGGMGEVYLAEDPRLGRKVALKVLSENLSADQQARHRFEQEARTASALNHPNIVTVHDIVTEGGRSFIVMEYVEGVTLRTLLQREPVDGKRALDIAAQVAAGLAAAHDARIIHRDIKPENVVISASGHVKILDFGLAKLTEARREFATGGDSTTLARAAVMRNETAQGTIVGTAAYMSPEQVEGRQIDTRSDIFSLGVVLYEMLTGKHPFSGKSPHQTLHAILHEEPPLTAGSDSHVPRAAADILAKALAKDPAERYRHASDFELDLRRLKRTIGSALSEQQESGTVPPTRRGRGATLGVTVAAALATGALALAAWQSLGPGASVMHPNTALTDVTLTPLTSDAGYEGEGTFSSDGETIAYVSDRSGNLEIYVKQISGGADINITANSADDVQPAFSPDGKQLAFVSTRASASGILYFGYDVPLMGGDIWVMPALGGNARRVAMAGNFPSWSPEGSHLLYTGGPQRKQKIYRVPASGGEAATIPVEFKSGDAHPRFLLYPSYSPDGRWILFEADVGLGNVIYVVAARGGPASQLAKGKRPAWRADSERIVYSNTEAGKNESLWEIPFSSIDGLASGGGRPLTVGRGRDTQPAVSRDGRLIAFTALEVAFHPELLPFDAESGRLVGPANALLGGNDIVYFMNFSPDGRSLVFESNRGASSHIWRLDQGSSPVPLTADASYRDLYPRWSPKGSLIAFIRRPLLEQKAIGSLWLMAPDGGNPRRVVENVGPFSFVWTPDGTGLVYFSPKDSQLYLFSLQSGATRRLTQEKSISFLPLVSYDGKWLIYQSTLSGNIDLRAMPFDGGASRVVAATAQHDLHPFLSTDDRWLYFQLDHKNIYRVPGPAQQWRGAAHEKVTNYPESNLFLEDPQLSPDGKQLLYSRGRVTGDIWLMETSRALPR